MDFSIERVIPCEIIDSWVSVNASLCVSHSRSDYIISLRFCRKLFAARKLVRLYKEVVSLS